MKYESTFTGSSELALLDHIIEQKISSNEFMNNEKIILELSNAVDRLRAIDKGYTLLSISHGNSTAILLITKTSTPMYNVTRWTKDESVAKNLEIKVLEESREDIEEYVNSVHVGGGIENADKKNIMLKESLTGYSMNKKCIDDLVKFCELKLNTKINRKDSSINPEMLEIADHIRKERNDYTQYLDYTVHSFAEKLDCDKLKVHVKHSDIDTQRICIAKIEEVKLIGNRRIAKFELISDGTSVTKNKITVQREPSSTWGDLNITKLGSLFMGTVRSLEETSDYNLTRIPYNFLDKDRYIVMVENGNSWNIIIGEDPRVDEKHLTILKETLTKYVQAVSRKGLSLDGTTINDSNKVYFINSYLEGNSAIQQPQASMKAIKKMVDEYFYLDKKKKAVGQDVNITDKIKYNHANGKIVYNDFSIAVEDELVKEQMFKEFEGYLVNFYRGGITEEDIIKNILQKIFYWVGVRITAYKQNTVMKITLNDKVVINMEQRLTNKGARLNYLNGNRFNLNEILVILKEMTCYRNQEDADNFINMIGKIGLSTYIAVTTGYEITNGDNSRIYKFRKEKGRSKYTLILDTIDLSITGKKLISMLYSNFIGEQPCNSMKISECIYSSTGNSLDYLKYKFLIDSSYKAFKEKSKEFLEKKMQDVGASHVVYINGKTHREMEGILVTGISNNQYVIAYNNKESFVFLNPVLTKEKTYKEGTYVCMIDQSNIKSNIGYDTVISKMLALRNDSVIAEQIYNLKDQLKDLGGDEGNVNDSDREDDN